MEVKSQAAEHTQAVGSLEDLRRQVNVLNWVHSIDLGNGIVTPGQWGGHNRCIWQAFDQIDFRGKKVLDIGCWDGLWSFEAEKRGASEIYATDLILQRHFQDQPTFKLAHHALHSKARYFPDVSVFDVKERLGVTDFDIVIFCGVYYHLKNPLLALAKLRSVMREGGHIIVEGEVFNNWDAPMARFYYLEHFVKDRTNWWVPNISCLKEWVACSFFEIVGEYNNRSPEAPSRLGAAKQVVNRILGRPEPLITSRYSIVAKAVCRADHGYAVPDNDLIPFDLNRYRS